MRMGLIENRAHYTTARCAIRSGATASPQRVSGNVDGGAPETLGGQLWGEGTIEPPIYGSPAIQNGIEVSRSRMGCPALTQGSPWIRFEGWGLPT
jgi:hypothetical protein